MGKLINSKSLQLLMGVAVLSLGGTSCNLSSKSEPPNTLHLVVDEKIKSLDPIYADDLYSGIQVSQVYETLVQYHYLKRPYVLIPGLAESMPEVSSDGLTYTFHIKKGVLFQDSPCFAANKGKGREMTAEDVVFSFKRLADPRLASTGWWIFDGKILGLNEWRDKASKANAADYSAPIEGLKVVDSHTLQLKLVHRSAQFLYSLAMPFTGIVPKEAVDFYGKDLVNHPVGTGPFQLVEYNPSSKAVWARNPTFHQELYPSEGEPGDKDAGLLDDAGKRLPLADRLVFQVFVERQPMWLNFLAGKLDVAAIPKDNFSSAINSKQELTDELRAKGMKLTKSLGLDVTHTSFNMADPLLGKNKYLRQALSLAYDDATYIQLFYNGRAIPAQGPIPPGIAGYDPSLKNPYRQFNVAKAKELLAKAGFPGGKGLPPIEYATTADSLGRQSGEYMQKIMAAIGVELKVNGYSWPQLLEVMKTKKAQMWGEAWGADYPDGENFLQLFYSKNVSPGPNDSNYMNPEFDRLYEKALTLTDGPERTGIYKKMVAILVEDCPWIFNSHRMGYGLTQAWLKNFKPNDFDHSRYKYYRVDPNLKK